ncbi:hypothetical protein [Singulisphaera sp. PoT]|uniref:hypothetical protein n=1 Tax=Singulisphaera sp. PoT TaxID=3411797 RepID=UPI003BF55524
MTLRLSPGLKCNVIFALLLLIACLPSLSKEDDAVVSVKVEDISSGKVKLIGRLGVPLRTDVKIEGTWDYPNYETEDGGLRFNVNLVDGKKPAKPIEFDIHLISVTTNEGKDVMPTYENRGSLKGKTWILTANESGYINSQINIFPLGKPTPKLP